VSAESLPSEIYSKAVFMLLRASSLLLALIGTGVSLSSTVHADALTINCVEKSFGKTSDLTLTYEGSDSGTLTIKAPYGEMALPANKEERTDESSGAKVTGIRASGPATVLMPDKAVIEACVKGKLKPEEAADEDIVYTVIGSCAADAPIGKEPIVIQGYAEIAIMEPPSAYVFITRTYVESTTLAGGKIKLDTLPPPNCSLAQ
jgi:hypothetical protein